MVSTEGVSSMRRSAIVIVSALALASLGPWAAAEKSEVPIPGPPGTVSTEQIYSQDDPRTGVLVDEQIALQRRLETALADLPGFDGVSVDFDLSVTIDILQGSRLAKSGSAALDEELALAGVELASEPATRIVTTSRDQIADDVLTVQSIVDALKPVYAWVGPGTHDDNPVVRVLIDQDLAVAAREAIGDADLVSEVHVTGDIDAGPSEEGWARNDTVAPYRAGSTMTAPGVPSNYSHSCTMGPWMEPRHGLLAG
ncbi:hypothetical protein H5392_06520 [Tessaracoccus sp. MC1865]|uniref:hypothetical protein n=1 Tax=Tessaracoccus sp. MC1865 TaxID=2760310 RepID=UPI001600F932|nr:hypothetical protein [Tessaracoccus sp. MC1865]MBB1483512.1 hypothetical protein [Tessaracoccus sp. MC1865]QTO36607.1 hypothetical protein J7D54_08895 [Tessaracoccus sp. MC1865]